MVSRAQSTGSCSFDCLLKRHLSLQVRGWLSTPGHLRKETPADRDGEAARRHRREPTASPVGLPACPSKLEGNPEAGDGRDTSSTALRAQLTAIPAVTLPSSLVSGFSQFLGMQSQPPPPKLPPSIMGGDCFNPHPRSLPQLRTPTRVSLFSLHLLGKGMEEKSHLWAAPARGHRRYFSVLTGSSVSCYCVIRLCLQRQLESSQGSLSVTMFLSYSSFSLQGRGWIHNLNSTASYAFPPRLPAPALTGHGTWEDPCHLLPSTCLQRLYPGACSRKHENWARRAGPLLESQARRRDGAFTIC